MNTKGLSEFVEHNWKVLGGLLAAVVLVLAVAGIWNERRKANEREATNLLYDAQLQARELIAQKKPKEAEQAFQTLLDRFPKTRAAYEASLQIGDLFMEAGQHAEAVKWYERSSAIAKDPFSKLLARYNLGIARETAGQFQEAVESYEAALKMEGSDFLKPEILMAKARCFEALQQIPRALEIYQQVQKDFAGRSYYSGAASAFEKLLTQAGAGSKP